jgi:hypothetical protein
MAVEIEVYSRLRPDRLAICRLAGWVMRAVLDVDDVEVALVEDDEFLWWVRWGTSVTAEVVEQPPGLYEFADRWSLTFTPRERGIDLSKLLAVILADVTAVLCDGFLRDEGDLIGHGEHRAGRSLSCLLKSSTTDESSALAAVRGG